MNESKVKQFFKLKTIQSKIILTCLIDCILLIVLILLVFSKTTMRLEETMFSSRLDSDITYLEDTIGRFEDGEWHIQDNALYRGNVLIGDATDANANLSPFLETEAKTGTFCYTFMRCGDEGLQWTGDEKTGYMQGHYIRVAGSTRGPNGESIIGTYMDKKVADVLDEAGSYKGYANVAGGMIYCVYHTFCNYDGEIVGAIVVGRGVTELEELASSAAGQMALLIIIIVVLAGLGILAITSRWTWAVTKINQYLNRIASGELPNDPLVLKSRDEIGSVSGCINDMVKSLKEKERIGAELSLATDIQANMLPRIFPPFPEHNEFDIFATMTPAKEVGGDFYDFFMTDDCNVAFVIADVSGKGVPAALFMVTAKTLIKDHAQLGLPPAEVFTRVNKVLCEGNDAGLFVTGWMGILNLTTGVLTYVNAGHNPPLHCGADGKYEFIKARPGFVLAGMDFTKYKQSSLQLSPGDRLFLYTDGVTEATDLKGELYGEERLMNYLNSNGKKQMTDVLHGVRGDIDSFVGEAEQFDDITMLMFEFKEQAGEGITERIFHAEDAEMPNAIAFVEEEMEKLEVPPKIAMQISVALEELFVNVAHYAYPGRSGDVKLELSSKNNTLTISLKDSGIPFNPLSLDDPDITLSAEERDIGGLGIFMVKKTMDDVFYKYQDGMNMLTIVKKY